MDADLVLEGGGVKGIGLVGTISVLEERGYRFRRVAGTSAGAVVASLVAAGVSCRELSELMRSVEYHRFVERNVLDRLPLLGKGLSLLRGNGVHDGRYLADWLEGILEKKGVRTFGDLRITDDDHAVPRERRYRLTVLTVDVSRRRLVRLPWDYPSYGLDPDEQPVVDAVRASSAIPFFYRPVPLRAGSGETSLLVDGAVVPGFPLDIFDRPLGVPPRWPTFGIKLMAPNPTRRPSRIANPLELGMALLATVAAARGGPDADEPCVSRRTIFVDTTGVSSIDFAVSTEAREHLYEQGRLASEDFLSSWDWSRYLVECRHACGCRRTEGRKGTSPRVNVVTARRRDDRMAS